MLQSVSNVAGWPTYAKFGQRKWRDLGQGNLNRQDPMVRFYVVLRAWRHRLRVAPIVADRRGFYRLRGTKKRKERKKERKGERLVWGLKNTTDWLHNLKWQRKGKSKLRRRPRDSIYHLFTIERSISLLLFLFDAKLFCSQRWTCRLFFQVSLQNFPIQLRNNTNVFAFSSSSARYFLL